LWRFRDIEAEAPLTITDALPGTSISPSAATLLLVEEGGISLKDVDSQEILVQLPGSAVSSAGSKFATFRNGRLGVYDGETGAEIRGWDWDGDAVTDLRLSPNGDQLLAINESNELWLARADADLPQRLARQAPRPSLIGFSPDGETVLTLLGELAVLWDTESGIARGAYPLGATERAAVQAAFSQGGDSIVFYLQLEDGLAGLTILELADSGVQRQTFVDVQTAALSTDGKYLSLAFGDGRVHIIATESGEVLGQLTVHRPEVRKLQYLPEADALITAAGSELILWDLSAGVVDQRFFHSNPVADFSLSRDGGHILTSDDGTYRLWQVESAEDMLARIVANYAPRDLTCAEREEYLVAPLCE
jgi:WD40 repeat protein